MLEAAIAIVLAATAVSDTEVWNEGVEYYRQGDVTNALRVLKPLTVSKEYGARAAEVVAKLAYENGELEEAAAAAQIALRANPGDERVNRNFTRASDRLPETRETARINRILKEAQGKDPGSMLQSATYDARKLLTESGTYRTNAAEKAVALCDSLSKRAGKLADVWIPLREVISQSVTNEEQAATIIAQIEAAQKKTSRAAKELGDFDGNAYGTMSDVEHDFTRFLKLTVMPPAAIGEDLIAQSNAWQDAETVNGRAWQPEALDYTRAFRSKFPAWARAYEQQAQSDTNKPPFTAEDQAKISALATELEKIQLECCEKNLPPSQEKALDLIREIQGLLPKDKNGGNGGGQGQPQANQDQQNQDQKDKQDKDDKQDQQQNDQQQDQKQEENPEDQKDQQSAEEKDQQEEQEKTPEDKDVEAVLQKAQERNDEHEAEKKARMRKAPLPPNERDW